MRELKTQLEEMVEESNKMQAECRKILNTLKDGKSKFEKLKDSCNTGLWFAGGVALLCVSVVRAAAAYTVLAPNATGVGCVAAVAAIKIGADYGYVYFSNKIAKTDEVIDQITKVEE